VTHKWPLVRSGVVSVRKKRILERPKGDCAEARSADSYEWHRFSTAFASTARLCITRRAGRAHVREGGQSAQRQTMRRTPSEPRLPAFALRQASIEHR
jgi:hypothetical protein